MKKFVFEKKIFKKYLMSYLAIIISVFLIISIWCFQNYFKYRNESIEVEASEAQNYADTTDEIFKNIYYSVHSLGKSNEYINVNRFGTKESQRVFWNKLSNYLYPYTKADRIIVFLEKSDKYIGDGVYNREDFYYTFFRYENMTKEDWEQEVLECTEVIKFLPVKKIFYNGFNREMLPVIFSVDKAKVIMLISPERISPEGKKIVISDLKNSVLYSEIGDVGSEILTEEQMQNFVKINKNKYLMTPVKSKFSTITYYVLSDKEQVLKNASVYAETAVIIFVFGILFELIFAVYLSAINVTPIQNLINKIKNEIRFEDKEITMNSIGNGVLKLIENNKSLQTKLEKNVETMRNVFLQRVLGGEFTTDEQIREYMKSFDIDMSASSYFVSAIEINGVSKSITNKIDIMEFATIKTFICDRLSEEFNGIGYVEMNDGKIVVICGVDEIHKQDFCQRMTKFLYEIKDKFGFAISVAVGDIYDGITGIFYSYTEASNVLDYMELSGREGVVKHSEIKEKSILFYYPIDLEQHIINLAKNGEKEEMEKVFGILYEENISKRQLSPMAFKYLKNAVISTFMRVAEVIFQENEQVENNVELLISEIKDENNSIAFFEKVTMLYGQICDVVSIKNKGKNQKMKNKIEEYLNSNYSNTELSLYLISKEFNLSESYFSRIFKDLFECNFSVWVENKRINEAIELMKNTNLKISEISSRIGYSNPQVMRRAFKKQTGVTPDDYRKKYE